MAKRARLRLSHFYNPSPFEMTRVGCPKWWRPNLWFLDNTHFRHQALDTPTPLPPIPFVAFNLAFPFPWSIPFSRLEMALHILLEEANSNPSFQLGDDRGVKWVKAEQSLETRGLARLPSLGKIEKETNQKEFSLCRLFWSIPIIKGWEPFYFMSLVAEKYSWGSTKTIPFWDF